MNKSVFKAIKTVLCLTLVFAFIFSLCACGDDSEKEEKVKELGKGENDFYLEIKKSDTKTTKYHIFTDEVTVGAALSELELVKYAQTDKGEIYISELDGKKVDFKNKKEFWAIYYKNEYLSSLPDGVGIMCGDTYVMKIEALDLPGIKFSDSKYQRSSDESEETETEQEQERESNESEESETT